MSVFFVFVLFFSISLSRPIEGQRWNAAMPERLFNVWVLSPGPLHSVEQEAVNSTKGGKKWETKGRKWKIELFAHKQSERV